MNILRNFALFLLLGAVTAPAMSEDIDLYSSSGSNNNVPNVLFFLDNTSNWSSNSQGWSKASVLANCGSNTTCQGYVTTIFGGNSSLKQGQVELRAIKLVLNNLVCGSGATLKLNVGLMLIASNKGTADGNSSAGGIINKAIKLMDLTTTGQTNCNALIAQLDLIDSNITAPAYKADSSADYGGPLYDAFKYFGGYTNPAQATAGTAGTPTDSTHFGPKRWTNNDNTLDDPAAFTDGAKTIYNSPITSANACGNNYIIVVGNTWPNQEYGTDQNATPPTNTLLTRLGYTPNQLYSTSKANIRFGDEWAQFLATTDVSSQSGKQTVKTYTLDIYNGSPDANQTTLLQSMAVNGGTGQGGYYAVNGDLKKLVDGFADIFTQIASVNSAFASAALPVSVNTQGTYLNQVFIGQFRPDGDARPRWAGNLKQYKFNLQTIANVQSIYLADKDGNAAVDNANNGLIKICAASYWTTDSGTYWQNVPSTQTPLGTCASYTGSTSLPYSDLPDGNIAEKGGVAEKLRLAYPGTPSVTSRVIKTCAASPAACTMTDFSTTSSGLSATLVNWARGMNTGDGTGDPTNTYQSYSKTATEARPTIHGDIVHSRPVVINYGTGSTNDVVVFYGAGDGMLHAIDGNQTGTTAGQELWAFVAPEFYTRFTRLMDNTPWISFPGVPTTVTPTPTSKDYFFDGSIGAYQERNSSGTITKVWLYPTMRRGGRMIYGFDATTRPVSSLATTLPTFKWRFGCPNLTNDTNCTGGGNATSIGQTWTTPKPFRLKNDSNLYLAIGGGYDSCEDTSGAMTGSTVTTLDACTSTSKGRGVFILNADTGAQVKYIDLTDTNLGGTAAGRVIADVVPVDTDFDGYADLLYIADSRGNLYRVNTSNSSGGIVPSSWASSGGSQNMYLLATVSDWTARASSRKFFYAPDVVVGGNTAFVLIGTGDREQPLNTSFASGVTNRFYGFRDIYATAVGTGYPAITNTQANSDTQGNTSLASGALLLNVTDFTLSYSTVISTTRGWFIDLVTSSSPLEQVVTVPATIGGVTYFSTYQPRLTSSTVCSDLGTGRGYALNFLTGGLRDGDATRESTFTSPGIPPSPVAGVVLVADNNGNQVNVPFIMGGRGSGSGTSGSAIEGGKVPIPITPTRKKVYRAQRIED